jgi:predicted metal-dependent phosphoesterase TrpH
VNLAEATTKQAFPHDLESLRQVFRSVRAESCPTRFNFHMHTLCSDGKLHPEALAQQATDIGLQDFAITDHHSVQGYRLAQHWLVEQRQQQQSRILPRLWVGVEVTATLLETEVHVLGYGFDPTHPLMEGYLQGKAPEGEHAYACNVVDAIHAARGLTVLAHPVRYRRSPEDLIAAAVMLGIDGVETYYAYDNPSPWRCSPNQTERIQRLSSVYGLLNTCGTDTHGTSLLQRL